MVEALYSHSITLDTTTAEAVLHTANFLGCQPLVAAACTYIRQLWLPEHFVEVRPCSDPGCLTGHSLLQRPLQDDVAG